MHDVKLRLLGILAVLGLRSLILRLQNVYRLIQCTTSM
jgi:hypothetical protein